LFERQRAGARILIAPHAGDITKRNGEFFNPVHPERGYNRDGSHERCSRGFCRHAIHREKVHNPVLKSLGLEGQAAFEKAVQLARQLPEDLGPDAVTLSRTGDWVIGYSQPPAAS